jgi:hypothetical protein
MSDEIENLKQQIAALETRLTFLENRPPSSPMSASDQQEFFKAVGRHVENIVRDVVPKAVSDLYVGVYQRANRYAKGKQVTHEGSMFVALTDVEPLQIPGQHQNWQLCVKAGENRRSPTHGVNHGR